MSTTAARLGYIAGMKIRRALFVLTASAAFALAALPLTACGGASGAKVANVKAGSMPEGQVWTGVYYSQQFGELHLVESGDNIVGKWKAKDESKWGKMSGTVQGNVFHFAWDEYQSGFAIGKAGHQHGKGYFVYGMNKDNQPALTGEYGNDEDETGAPWNAMKEKDRKPHLEGIGGATDVDTFEKDKGHPDDAEDTSDKDHKKEDKK